MAIIDCTVWGVTSAGFDGVQNSGRYTVRFHIKANAVYGAYELLLLAEQFVAAGQNSARMPLPKKWSTYNYKAPLGSTKEVDRGSFCKRRIAQLRDVNSGFYNWWVDLIYEPLEPGELPPLDPDSGDLLEDPTLWPIVYRLETFTTSEVIDRGIPKDAQVRAVTNDLWGTQYSETGFIPDFEDVPTEPPADVFVPITNQAGDPPTRYTRQNVNRPMLVARVYLRDLYTFYKDVSRAKRTANKAVFFNQKPGYARFRDGRIVGGRRYDGKLGNEFQSYNFYEAEYRWELWGDVPTLSETSGARYQSNLTQDSKEIPIASTLVANHGFNAWSAAAPSGSLQPITRVGTDGLDHLVPYAWPLEQDGTAKAITDATLDVYGWWVLTPYDYTQMADGRIASNWPQYDYETHKERTN